MRVVFVLLILSLFTGTAWSQANEMAADICPIVEKYFHAETWQQALDEANVRSQAFHDAGESGSIKLSAMRNFIARFRDGFALQFISLRELQQEIPLFTKLMEVYRTAEPNIDLRNLTEAHLATVEVPKPFYETARFNENYEALRTARENAAILAEPLVRFLLSQPERSLTPSQLLKAAAGMYGGDVLSAYGVIGFIFYEEAKGTTVRPLHQVLASKMKPLIDDADSVGTNYHFWTYFSLGLQGHKWLAVSASVFLERIRQDDKAENRADLLGLEAGLRVRRCLGKPGE